MSTLTLTRGLPASGKSTFAKEFALSGNGVRVNRDDIRAMLFTKPAYSNEQEKLVSMIEVGSVDSALKAGRNVVVDAMHLRPQYVRAWRKLAAKHGAAFEVLEFPADVATCVARDAEREHPIGETFIRKQASKFMPKGKFLAVPDDAPEPKVRPYVRPDYWQPKVIIVDIDGTVALNTGGRSPYDMTRVSEDTPNEVVIEAVRAMIRAGHEVIFCSGRNECARADTEVWLKEHVTDWWDHLFMRFDGDQRKDSVVKLEMFDNHIRYNYNVVAVFDDRDQVVDMWRSLGLTCMQVAPGDF